MATHKSAEKRMRQNRKARLRNRIWKSRIRTARNKLEKAIESKKKASLESLYREYVSMLDRAALKHVIHRNNASRKKTRIAAKIKALQTSLSSK